MKKVFSSLMTVIVTAGILVIVGAPGICAAGELIPVVSLGTPLVKLDKKAAVVIMGTGFKPEQEVNIAVVTSDGVTADISYALKPVPKADKTGSWSTTWSAGRYVDKKLVKKGAYKLIVFDSEYNAIAHTAVYFAE
jgi:hypothetical protein